MFRRNSIPIFYACDKKFWKYTMISIHSLMCNASKEFEYNIYILCLDISSEMDAYVKKLSNDKFKIAFVNINNNLVKIKEMIPLRDYYSMTTYYRLCIPDMFPEYNKAIYIDSDTIVLGDISELYHCPIGKNYVAAVSDQPVRHNKILGDYIEKVLGIDENKYFNAGVIIMNCKQFRENHLFEEFIELLGVYTFVVAQDQDYLNIICKDQVKWIDSKWNAQIFGDMECSYNEIKILHFNMVKKPWKYKDCKYSEYFWKYAKNTELYEEIYQEMLNYTEEDRKKDRISGENLIQLAISEINKEDNFLNKIYRGVEKSEDRIEILKKIQELERKGIFDKDVEDDPEAPVLMPEDINYLSNSLRQKLRTKYAFKIAGWFVNFLIRQKKLIIKEIVGSENFEKISGGAVMTCNHFNAFDSFAMQLAFDESKQKKKKMYRVIREGNYTGFPGFYGFLMRNCNTLPLSSNFKTMEKFIRAVDKVLNKGDFVLIYPEQSMWWNYRKPKPLKKGAFTFAAKNNVPIIPCFITMEDSDVIDGDGFFIQEYTIHIGEPIFPDENKSKGQNAIEMRDKNYEIWKNIYEETYKIPLSYLCDEINEQNNI